MAVGTQEALRRPWVTKSRHDLMDQEGFLDSVSMIAVRQGTDVEIRDFTRVENTGKDYWGPDISVLSLLEARERVSQRALDIRISHQRYIVDRSNAEIRRIEEIRTKLYGESKGGEGQPSPS